MIRVNAQRLDLHALDPGEEVRILTGTSGIQIISADRAGEISLGLVPTGSGERWIPEGNVKNRWLRLPSLDPLRMYWLTARRPDPTDRDSTVVHFRDITPGKETEATPKSTGQSLFGRLLRR
jgi:hypothetical protein